MLHTSVCSRAYMALQFHPQDHSSIYVYIKSPNLKTQKAPYHNPQTSSTKMLTQKTHPKTQTPNPTPSWMRRNEDKIQRTTLGYNVASKFTAEQSVKRHKACKPAVVPSWIKERRLFLVLVKTCTRSYWHKTECWIRRHSRVWRQRSWDNPFVLKQINFLAEIFIILLGKWNEHEISAMICVKYST